MKLCHRRQELRLTRTWTIARGSSDTVPVVIVEVSDGNGLSGLGEASPIARYGESVETVERFLQRIEPGRLTFSNIPESMAYLDRLSSADMAAKCAVNIALLDGAAKCARKPLYEVLGLGFTEGRHVTSFSIGIDSPDIIREKVAAAADYPVLKLKVGVRDDQAIMTALRATAPSKPVRVDANEGWQTREEALRRIEWLAQDGEIQFVEQPMPASTRPEDLVWLKERSPLPLFADESYHTAADAESCARCFHGVNVKLVKTGGVSGGYDALQAARDRGLKTMIGCMIESSVLISAAAQLAELCDFLDVDGNLLITNDPYTGVTAERGILSFARSPEPHGIRVCARS